MTFKGSGEPKGGEKTIEELKGVKSRDKACFGYALQEGGRPKVNRNNLNLDFLWGITEPNEDYG